ncbi:hypothetical protein [Mycoavidus cysteinexigens]|uniref:hypothetical protein n=1 Tax=Mycoavidus cysteinexigens TaxID=1553431 RepID=UPI000F823DB9|nr:hypothetical protein [Mycoavidus cysteinexigens]
MYCIQSYPSPPKISFFISQASLLKQNPKEKSPDLQYFQRSSFSFRKLAPSLCAFYFHFTDFAQIQPSIEAMIKPKSPHLPLIRPAPLFAPFSTPYRQKFLDFGECCEATLAFKQNLIS